MATISSRAPGLARLAREEAGGAPSLGAAGVNDSREMPVVAGAARVDTPRSRDAPRVGPPARTPEEDARLVDISDRASSPPRRAAPASLRLADLGIPAPVVDRFVASGVKSGLVYPWQRAAIDEGADGSSLVYCAPTSGGKSLVANVLLVRRLVRRMRSGRPARALVVLPFHSLVNEKVEDLKTILAPMYPRKRGRDGARGLEPVRGFAGESEGGLKAVSVHLASVQSTESLDLEAVVLVRDRDGDLLRHLLRVFVRRQPHGASAGRRPRQVRLCALVALRIGEREAYGDREVGAARHGAQPRRPRQEVGALLRRPTAPDPLKDLEDGLRHATPLLLEARRVLRRRLLLKCDDFEEVLH